MTSSHSPDKYFDEARSTFSSLRKFNSTAMNSFLDFVHDVEADGVLSAKFKQIIIVAISIVKQCNWCIIYHTRKALKMKATREELLEACLTASLMGGGPSMMYTRLVMDEIDNWEKKKTNH